MEQQRLPDIARLAFVAVEADLAEVEAYMRGQYLNRNLDTEYHRRIAEEDDWHPSYDMEYTILRDESIGRERYFGWCGANFDDMHQYYRSFYNVWEENRISVIKSNLRMVLVEGSHSQTIITEAGNLAVFLRRPVFEFASRIAWDINAETVRNKRPEPPKVVPPFHYMRVVRADHKNDVSAFAQIGDRVVGIEYEDSRYKFRQRGSPLPFETPAYYRRRLVKERFDRNIICEYLDRLGIDPEATFERREVSKTVLITSSEFGGESLAPYQADADRYAALFSYGGDYWSAEHSPD